jgi:hypothetical protein
MVTNLIIGAEYDVGFSSPPFLIFVLILGVRIIEITIDGLGVHNNGLRRSRLRK